MTSLQLACGCKQYWVFFTVLGQKGLSKTLVETQGFSYLHLLPFLHFFRCFSGENGSFALQIVQFLRTWCSNHFISYFEIEVSHVSKFFNHFRGNSNLQKNEKKKKRGKKRTANKATDKNEKPMRSSFLHASAILFSSVLVHLRVVNSTVNEVGFLGGLRDELRSHADRKIL